MYIFFISVSDLFNIDGEPHHLIETVLVSSVEKRSTNSYLSKNNSNVHFINLADIDAQTLRYKIELPRSRQEFLLDLKPDDHFIAPQFSIENRFGDYYRDSVTDDSLRKCFYTGTVLEEENAEASINLCNGLVCFFKALFLYGLFAINYLEVFTWKSTNCPYILLVIVSLYSKTDVLRLIHSI